ncbi:hypothetical protein [Bradyrhizobium sp. BRP23]|uniref:hypothetical protein n=1 Tax=Bradyrhizobium sp. BRP23 TaxID=2793820 RepID=UPI001CD4AC14|nr:hypothetical protein [Bradyrhizobium sp. BRP23]MCA1381276.1 hypothetical protein [Bradyrhizobium sp. BRP05]MCA1418604.1 hypothetical protein [Bradyrhizobium sp. BRP23]
MRAARAILFGLDRQVIVGAVRVVIADETPKVILYQGDPFLPMPAPPGWDAKAVLAYGQERPYRADDGLLEVAGASLKGEVAS